MTRVVQTLALGDWALEAGGTLDDARLVYQTWGELAPARDNVIVMPTYYTGTHADNARLIGVGRALDPARWFIIVPNLFGNGVSTSPSNAKGAQHAAGFPTVSVRDNVRAQRWLLQERFGIARVRLVLGWSMGAMQAYQWAASYPDAVDALLCICGAARTSPHNRVFLEGVKAALTADQDFAGGAYQVPPARGLRAFARVYAGWAYSQAFFRRAGYTELGFESIAALLQGWEDDHLACDANDLLAMLATWMAADIADAPDEGAFERTLARIAARAIVMPCRTDLYFPPEDNAYEVAAMPRAELEVLESDWGHIAGGPGRNAQATRQIEAAVRRLLCST